MAVTAKPLIGSKEMEAAQTTQYTATNCTAIIDKFTATNTSASNAVISVNLVSSGGSAGSAGCAVYHRCHRCGFYAEGNRAGSQNSHLARLSR